LTDNENTELLKLIRNEIDLGFTLIETYRLSSSADHSYQALAGAWTALKTARRFLQGLANEEANAFEPELQRLEIVVRKATAEIPEYPRLVLASDPA
jgi:hypothetical protein